MNPENKNIIFEPTPREELDVIAERLRKAFEDRRSGDITGGEYSVLVDTLQQKRENLARVMAADAMFADLDRSRIRNFFGRE